MMMHRSKWWCSNSSPLRIYYWSESSNSSPLRIYYWSPSAKFPSGYPDHITEYIFIYPLGSCTGIKQRVHSDAYVFEEHQSLDFFSNGWISPSLSLSRGVWFWLGAGGGRERGTRAAKQIGRKKKADFFSRHHPIFLGDPTLRLPKTLLRTKQKVKKVYRNQR
jgi:hypothetical protein